MSKFMASVLTLFVAAMFGSLLGAQTTPNLFWFRFEETSGSSSTNQATLAGSMFGGFTVTTSGLFTDGMGLASPRIQPGAVGTGAVNLFGVSAWLDTGLPGTTLNASSFTVECWVNTNNVSQEGNAVFSICTNTSSQRDPVYRVGEQPPCVGGQRLDSGHFNDRGDQRWELAPRRVGV